MYGPPPGRGQSGGGGPMPPRGGMMPPSGRGQFGLPPPQYEDEMSGGQGGMLQQGAVLMAYGLDSEKFNCQRVFNLFCLYGNVVRV